MTWWKVTTHWLLIDDMRLLLWLIRSGVHHSSGYSQGAASAAKENGCWVYTYRGDAGYNDVDRKGGRCHCSLEGHCPWPSPTVHLWWPPRRLVWACLCCLFHFTLQLQFIAPVIQFRVTNFLTRMLFPRTAGQRLICVCRRGHFIEQDSRCSHYWYAFPSYLHSRKLHFSHNLDKPFIPLSIIKGNASSKWTDKHKLNELTIYV